MPVNHDENSYWLTFYLLDRGVIIDLDKGCSRKYKPVTTVEGEIITICGGEAFANIDFLGWGVLSF